MKLYTLEYDCNRPMPQQINVPTNTDYKVGVKIIRDGQVDNIPAVSMTLNGLSADAETTNGYVTFTKSAGAEASMTSENLEVDYQPLIEEAITFLSSQSNRTKQGYVAIEISSDNELIGKSVSMFDFYNGSVTKPLTAEHLVDDDARAAYHSSFWPFSTNTAMLVIGPTTGYTGPQYRGMTIETDEIYRTDPAYIETLTEPLPPKGVPYILRFDIIDGVQKATPVQAIEIYEGLRIGHSYAVRGSQTIAGVKIQLGEPLNANFKLTENIYKSQVGDIEASYSKEESDEALAGKVTNLSAVSGIMKISQADYAEKSIAGEIDANTLYIIVE